MFTLCRLISVSPVSSAPTTTCPPQLTPGQIRYPKNTCVQGKKFFVEMQRQAVRTELLHYKKFFEETRAVYAANLSRAIGGGYTAETRDDDLYVYDWVVENCWFRYNIEERWENLVALIRRFNAGLVDALTCICEPPECDVKNRIYQCSDEVAYGNYKLPVIGNVGENKYHNTSQYEILPNASEFEDFESCWETHYGDDGVVALHNCISNESIVTVEIPRNSCISENFGYEAAESDANGLTGEYFWRIAPMCIGVFVAQRKFSV